MKKTTISGALKASRNAGMYELAIEIADYVDENSGMRFSFGVGGSHGEIDHVGMIRVIEAVPFLEWLRDRLEELEEEEILVTDNE